MIPVLDQPISTPSSTSGSVDRSAATGRNRSHGSNESSGRPDFADVLSDVEQGSGAAGERTVDAETGDDGTHDQTPGSPTSGRRTEASGDPDSTVIAPPMDGAVVAARPTSLMAQSALSAATTAAAEPGLEASLTTVVDPAGQASVNSTVEVSSEAAATVTTSPSPGAVSALAASAAPTDGVSTPVAVPGAAADTGPGVIVEQVTSTGEPAGTAAPPTTSSDTVPTDSAETPSTARAGDATIGDQAVVDGSTRLATSPRPTPAGASPPPSAADVTVDPAIGPTRVDTTRTGDSSIEPRPTDATGGSTSTTERQTPAPSDAELTGTAEPQRSEPSRSAARPAVPLAPTTSDGPDELQLLAGTAPAPESDSTEATQTSVVRITPSAAADPSSTDAAPEVSAVETSARETTEPVTAARPSNAATNAAAARLAEHTAVRELMDQIERHRLTTSGSLEVEIQTDRFGAIRIEAMDRGDGVQLSLRGDGASQQELADLARDLREQFGRGEVELDVEHGGGGRDGQDAEPTDRDAAAVTDPDAVSADLTVPTGPDTGLDLHL